MQPETVLAELARRAGAQPAPHAEAAPARPVARGEAEAFAVDEEPIEQQAEPEAEPAPQAEPIPATGETIYDNISASYRQLRLGMVILAVALPLTLILGGGLDTIQTSMSAYYHSSWTLLRDVFVGILWAVGAFLVFYKGYTGRENVALNVAGVSAALIALFPTACESAPGQSCAAIPSFSMTVHSMAAVGFFALIAYVCVFRSRDTLQLMRDEAKRAMFQNVYRVLGFLMVAMPLVVIAIHFLARRERSWWILIVEVIGIGVFATFWHYKSREIRLLEQQGG